MSENYRNFMGYLWVQKEDNVYTIGVNEDGLEEIEEINAVDLPQEDEEFSADAIIATIDTDDGPLDIYTPVEGKVIEVNTAVAEDPALIQEDPYDAWLVKIESDQDMDEVDDDDEEDDDDDDDDEEEEDEE